MAAIRRTAGKEISSSTTIERPTQLLKSLAMSRTGSEDSTVKGASFQ
jgi:hypothetical protein